MQNAAQAQKENRTDSLKHLFGVAAAPALPQRSITAEYSQLRTHAVHRQFIVCLFWAHIWAHVLPCISQIPAPGTSSGNNYRNGAWLQMWEKHN